MRRSFAFVGLWWIRVLVFSLCLLPLAAGCGSAKKATEEQRAAVVVLIDMTSSAADDANLYMQSVTTVLNALKGGDTIYVVPFTGSYLPEILVSKSLPAATFNPVQDGIEMKAALQEVQHKVAQLLQSQRPAERGTSIFTGIQKAAAIFAQETGAAHTLVILSDMVEQGKYDFTKVAPTTPETLIDQLEKERQLPRLDASVYVAGLASRTGDGYRLTQDQFQAISDFWAAYFKRVGADLVSYNRELLKFTVKR